MSEGSLVQRREFNRHTVQPMKQIFPEEPTFGGIRQIAVSRSDEANIELSRPPTERFHFASFENA